MDIIGGRRPHYLQIRLSPQQDQSSDSRDSKKFLRIPITGTLEAFTLWGGLWGRYSDVRLESYPWLLSDKIPWYTLSRTTGPRPQKKRDKKGKKENGDAVAVREHMTKNSVHQGCPEYCFSHNSTKKIHKNPSNKSSINDQRFIQQIAHQFSKISSFVFSFTKNSSFQTRICATVTN